MSDKRPQTTDVLLKRLRRVAKWFDEVATAHCTDETRPAWNARANTCWQAAARLEELRARVRAVEKTL